MNPDPDYSAAYVVLETDGEHEGHGLTFTLGRGNELCIAGIESLAPRLVGVSLEEITSDMGAFWRHLTGDSQLRWIGPDKGVIHLATGAVVNALWDLWGRSTGKPVWQLVTDMTPEEIVRCIDFRYLTNALTAEACSILERAREGRDERPLSSWPGLPDLHHLRRLAGLLGRQAPQALPGGSCSRMDPPSPRSGPTSRMIFADCAPCVK